jgi:eukaryotic-like serine/threonine-protein kinase
VSDFLVDIFGEPNPDNAQGKDVSARSVLAVGVRRIDEDLAGQPVLQARLEATMARSYAGLGDLETAAGLFRRALDRVPVGQPALRADLFGGLGGTYRSMRRLGEARAALDSAVSITEPRVDTATTASMAATPELFDALTKALQETGVVASLSGDAATAVPTLERAFRLRQRFSGPDAVKTAEAATDLAYGYTMAGSLLEAKRYYDRAVRIYTDSLTSDDPSLLLALDGLASNYGQRQVFDSAAAIFERILPIQRKVWGPEHMRTAQTLNNLGGLNSAMGNDDVAERYLREALDINTKLLGPDNLALTAELSNLALLRSKAGDYAGAERLFQRATEIRRKTIGVDNPRYASTLLGVANARRQLGKWSASEAAYGEALGILRPLGKIPPEALSDYAQVLRKLGRAEDARAAEREHDSLTVVKPKG